jgi:hypothetical protein
MATTSDPDGDRLYYRFEWGDGSMSHWLGPYASGGEVSHTHTWNTTGTYEIRVKAKDEYGEESAWSDPLAVSMPLSYRLESIFTDLDGWPEGILSTLWTFLVRLIYAACIAVYPM